jgi:hypothetical protein
MVQRRRAADGTRPDWSSRRICILVDTHYTRNISQPYPLACEGAQHVVFVMKTLEELDASNTQASVAHYALWAVVDAARGQVVRA